MNTNQIDSRFHHVIGLQGSWYLEAGLGLEGGEGAWESGGLDEGGDGGDHRGPRLIYNARHGFIINRKLYIVV